MSNPSILVIDDDFAVREAISAGLRQEGYDLLFAESGADALDVLKGIAPHVVILDLKMPVMDGLEFLSKVRLGPPEAFSVVVLSAHVDDAAAEACFKAGISALIKKPFTLNELRGAVQTAITNRERSKLFKDLMIERVAGDVIQDKISQRLDVLGKYLQELAQLQRKATNFGQSALDFNTADPLDLTGLDGTPIDAESDGQG